MCWIAAGHAWMAPIGPPETVPIPINGRVWMTMMIMPMPDMNPETTE